jgi:hypothetical protein
MAATGLGGCVIDYLMRAVFEYPGTDHFREKKLI